MQKLLLTGRDLGQRRDEIVQLLPIKLVRVVFVELLLQDPPHKQKAHAGLQL